MAEAEGMGDAIKQIGDALERIFRHLLPGACLVIAARLSHPSWFRPSGLLCAAYSPTQQLILLAVIAVCAGNVWYVFHRFSVHQLMEWAIYLLAKKEPPKIPYRKWLIGHISKRFSLAERGEKPVELRSAQIIFMVIVCEIALICAVWHEQDSWFGKIQSYGWKIAIAAVTFWIVAIWQHYILFEVDKKLVESRPASGKSEKDP